MKETVLKGAHLSCIKISDEGEYAVAFYGNMVDAAHMLLCVANAAARKSGRMLSAARLLEVALDAARAEEKMLKAIPQDTTLRAILGEL